MWQILILINFLWLTKIIAWIVDSKKKEVKEVWELLRLSNPALEKVKLPVSGKMKAKPARQ